MTLKNSSLNFSLCLWKPWDSQRTSWLLQLLTLNPSSYSADPRHGENSFFGDPNGSPLFLITRFVTAFGNIGKVAVQNQSWLTFTLQWLFSFQSTHMLALSMHGKSTCLFYHLWEHTAGCCALWSFCFGSHAGFSAPQYRASLSDIHKSGKPGSAIGLLQIVKKWTWVGMHSL